MALQTSDGVLHPADLDEYGQYQPVHELIRLISYNADLAVKITEDTRAVLRQALLGEHPFLSHPLVGTHSDKEELLRILEVMHPQTEIDFVRTQCLIHSDGLYAYGNDDYPIVCREELCDYLSHYLNKDQAFALSEAIRKGKFYRCLDDCQLIWDNYREELTHLPNDAMELFSKIKYLPKKSVYERIVHYAIIVANSLIQNDNTVVLSVQNISY